MSLTLKQAYEICINTLLKYEKELEEYRMSDPRDWDGTYEVDVEVDGEITTVSGDDWGDVLEEAADVVSDAIDDDEDHDVEVTRRQ